MKIKEITNVDKPPKDLDIDCISLYYTLNRLPGVYTFESCSGHGVNAFNIWFFCDNIDTLSRLGRAVSPNYSDGNWEILVDTTDTNPKGCFWLRSVYVLGTQALRESINRLIDNILYWFKDEFDNYFLNNNQND